MSYKSILVNLDIDGPIIPLVKLATDLASRFDARLVGFCAADAPFPTALAPEGGAIAVEVWQDQKDEIDRRFKELHAHFDNLAAGSVKSEWREVMGNPTRSLASAARLADLIITGAAQGASTGDSYRAVDPGSVAIQAGRPVLVAAGGAERMLAQKAVVAWKDTREARRAVADAVPLLSLADEVVVATVTSESDDWIQEGVDDIVAFLAAHGIKARSEVVTAKDDIGALTEFVTSLGADLVVSGAYGHSRIREWALGGVTRSLLDDVRLSRFMSN
jgi:nucleotide-binding universal stress UspA family protein